MGLPVNGLTVFLGQTSTAVSAGNAIAPNPNGTINRAATVVGVGQGVQSLVSIATTDIPLTSVPLVGAGLGTVGAVINAQSIAVT